jgi:hypothetical protein
LERKRAVADNECRNQRQRYYDPADHQETPQIICVAPTAKMLCRTYEDKDVLGAVKPR